MMDSLGAPPPAPGGGGGGNGGGNSGGNGGGGALLLMDGYDLFRIDHIGLHIEPPPPPPPPPKQRRTHLASSIGSGSIAGGGGGGGGACGGADTWMDPRVWRRIPERLLDRILAALPVAAFFRCRCVCKRWYALLLSDSFLEMAAAAAARRRRPCFLLFRRRSAAAEGFLYDPSGAGDPSDPSRGQGQQGQGCWSRLPLAFLPPNLAVVSSGAGLLCCVSQLAGVKTVIICNPFTRSCVQLPPTIKERFVPTIALIPDDSSSSSSSPNYKLVVAGDDLISPFAVKNLTTEEYSSELQAWRITGALPRLCNLESAKATCANGMLYCMNYSPFGVLVYDLASGAWSKIQAPMRRFLRSPSLVECMGKLVMVAAVEKNRLNVPKSIRLWSLQHPKNTWVELERMPQPLYDDFMRVSHERAFDCVAAGSTILVMLQHSPHLLAFDLHDKLWRWLPQCPFVSQQFNEDGEEQGFHGFAFEPRLGASAYQHHHFAPCQIAEGFTAS